MRRLNNYSFTHHRTYWKTLRDYIQLCLDIFVNIICSRLGRIIKQEPPRHKQSDTIYRGSKAMFSDGLAVYY